MMRFYCEMEIEVTKGDELVSRGMCLVFQNSEAD